MNARQRRIFSDQQRLRQLSEQSSLIEIIQLTDAGDRYRVFYHCKGLVWLAGSPSPSVTTRHAMDVYLHVHYPRLPPRLQWLTDIFHPNILPPSRNGGVCVGKWTPAESLDRLIVRIGEMVQYKNYSTVDALNLEAARWAELNQNLLPVDRAPLVREVRSIERIGVD